MGAGDGREGKIRVALAKGQLGGKLAGMSLLHVVCMEGQTLPWLFDLPLQSFAVLALIPIWLYDGRKGRGGKWMQYGAYLYYPLHLLLLVVLRRIL